jgi:hypothetical protein
MDAGVLGRESRAAPSEFGDSQPGLWKGRNRAVPMLGHNPASPVTLSFRVPSSGKLECSTHSFQAVRDPARAHCMCSRRVDSSCTIRLFGRST